MIVQQQTKNLFTKKPDRIDSHILKIIERYFETSQEAIEGTREEIIQETIRRVRQDTITSLRQLILDEMRAAINDEFGTLIDARINDIILDIYQGIYDVPVIKTYDFQITMQETQTFIPIEDGLVKMKNENDTCDILLNGLAHKDYTLETNEAGYITRIVLPESDVLIPGDRLSVRFQILFEKQTQPTENP